MDLALALKPLLLAHGMEKVTNDPNTDSTYQDSASGWRVTLDPGTENWVAIWDAGQSVICEARVTSPVQAINLLQVFGLLRGVQATND